MSKSAGDKEDEDEYFYESLDRIISSTSSSSSEDEDAKASNFNLPNPNSPMGVFNEYDVWISEPASVDERRMRLLHHMGLSRDPSLSRFKPPSSTDSGGGNSYRSVGAQIFSNIDNSISNPGMILPKPDNATDQCISSSNNNNINLNSLVFECNSPADVNDTYVNNHNVVVKSRSSGDGSLCIVDGSSISSNKPPSGRSRRTDSKRFNLEGDCNALLARENGGGEEGESLDCDAIVRVGDDPACTIKNLDTGKKFVVNEVTGDGTWKKLKEVGTGRQLTMEEFEMCVGHSPIVQELMRRQNVEDSNNKHNVELNVNGSGPKLKKKGNWLRSIKNVASSVRGHKDRRSSDERDTSSEKGGQRSSSATDDSQEISFLGPEKIRVRQYGKSSKELTGLYKSQEFQAHNGSIWTIKFSLDGKYLASAGEDCVIHVWQVAESERKGGLLLDKQEDGNLKHLFLPNGFPEPNSMSANLNSHREKKRRGWSSISRKSVSFEHILVPETVFALSEKPLCSFQGHLHDVLDLSWSESQHLLSSSMDKTVRLWHLSSNSCLKTFSHSDYVTCIQFNPADDKYFISGSLDAKVRIWSIPDHQVVDWNDLHEMVTAACYTPDGQGALVGSYKGSCRLYNTSENKLLQQSQIKLHNKKPCHKKITGFQFAPGSTSEVLITSADSQIRVIDGVDLVHKFKGFRNTSSQISASITGNGKYVVCASEDSQVYIWKQEGDSRPSRTKGVTVTRSYEHFHCQDISAAIPWPVMCDSCGLSRESNQLDEISTENHSPTPAEETNNVKKSEPLTNSYSFDRFSATWPEEKLLLASKNRSHQADADFSNGVNQRSSAWGMVIVTAGLRGEIRTFQNFGMPFRI